MQDTALPKSNVNYWFPSTYNRGPNLLVWLALLSCFTTVLIKLNTGTSVSRWPEAITTLLFLHPLITQWHTLKRSIWLKLWGLAILCPFVFFGINYLQDPAAAVKYSEFEKLARIYLFVPIVWWLGANKKTISIYLTLALIGFLVAVVTGPDFKSDLIKAIDGTRVHLSVQGLNWQQSALFFSIGLIGCLSYLAEMFKPNTPKNKSIIAAISIAAVVCLLGIVATQTRAAYLGLLLCAVIAFIRLLIKLLTRKNYNSTQKLIITTTAIFSILVGAFALKPIANNTLERASKESNVLSAVIARDWDNIPYNSFGIRINTWVQALEWIKEKPLIGYGGKVRKHIIEASTKHSEYVMKHVRHFHNSFIELTLGYGLLGMLLAIAPFVILAWKMKKKNNVSNFTFYGSILFLVMNCFESYLFFWVGPFILTILLTPSLKPLSNKT